MHDDLQLMSFERSAELCRILAESLNCSFRGSPLSACDPGDCKIRNYSENQHKTGWCSFLRTGLSDEGLLDVHLITDADITERSSYAVKIDAITDPARKLPMKEA